MKVFADLHTHSVASGHHTTDTVTDLCKRASALGFSAIGITEHAPAMLGAASESYFRNVLFAEKRKCGVDILFGAELNVLDVSGKIDLPDDILCNLVYSVASLHKDVIRPVNEAKDTEALVRAAENPFVNIIGHPDDPTFSVNFQALTDAAKETCTALELNSVSLAKDGYRKKNVEGLVEMLLLCKQKGVYVSLGSDSHGRDHVGDFGPSFSVLQTISFPDDLIINKSRENFYSFLQKSRQKGK